MRKRLWKFLVIALVIGFFINTFVPMLFGFKDFHKLLLSIPVKYVLVPFLIYIFGYFVDAIRLKIVANIFGYKTRLIDGFTNSVYAYMFSYLTPMAAGGQPFQIWHLSTIGISTEDGTSIVLSRFVEYMFTTVAIALISYRRIIDVIKANVASVALIQVGFIVSLGAAVLFFFLLVRPDFLGKVIHKMQDSAMGKMIAKLSRKEDWGERIYNWTVEMKKSVDHLWRKNFWVAVLDTALNFLIILAQVYSIFYVLRFVSPSVHYWKILAFYTFLNLVVYYIPTPGASGSIEAAYTLVFSAFMGNPQRVLVAVSVWRISTYYFHILFEIIWIWIFGNVKREGSSQKVI